MGEGAGRSRRYREGVAECGKLPVNWCGSLTAVLGSQGCREMPPVPVLLRETENAGHKKEKGEFRENQESDRFEIAK